MKYTLRRPSCLGCPHNLHFGDFVPKKQYGVMMHTGEHTVPAANGRAGSSAATLKSLFPSGVRNAKILVSCGYMS